MVNPDVTGVSKKKIHITEDPPTPIILLKTGTLFLR
jgi:hypothetical protein